VPRAGKDNTSRIEILEDRTSSIVAKLGVIEFALEGISENLKKGMGATEGHGSRITVIEQRILVLVELKQGMASIAAIEKEVLALKKDLESIGKWKEELKKEREEGARRFWAFGPNLVAAIISGLITLIGVAITVGLNYWLLKK